MFDDRLQGEQSARIMTALQRTPLYAFHARHNARFVPFAGWEMPVQYTGILEEHRAVRATGGLFDVSHMGEARITGANAAEFVDYLMANEMATLPAGQARYTVMCYPSGGAVDDLIVYRVGPQEYFICLNASNADKDVAWMQEHAKRFGCKVENESPRWAQLAIQGPRATEILRALLPAGVELPGRFKFATQSVGGVSCIVSRTGYTGEDGAELYCGLSDAEKLAEALMETGKPLGLVPVGLGARDSLRLEAGYPLYGHELGENISPLTAGLAWTVKLKRQGDFIGKAALSAEITSGSARQILFFKLDDRRIARQGAPVFFGDRKVGEVASGTLSPSLNQPIGSALVELAGVDLDKLTVDIRQHRIPMLRVKPPFLKLPV